MEVCNGEDDDCDGEADQDGTSGCALLYADVDGDGFGNPEDSKCYCAPQGPYTVADNTDCDDLASVAFPGNEEVCDGFDNDCNGVVDDAPPEADCIDFYVDGDKDGFGAGEPACLCVADDTYTVTQPGDCNDADPTAYPGGQETCAPADENCNGQVNEAGALGCVSFFEDVDGDGWGVGSAQCVCTDDPVFNATQTGDCYDLNPDAKPGQAAWFTVNRGDGSFDYDCDNTSLMKWTKGGGDCGSWPGCSNKEGWDNNIPNCGQIASYVYDCDTKAFGCDKETENRVQECH